MAELNSLTVKKLDIAIASFNDQKKRKENLSNGTQKKLDGLIKKYTDTKKLILTTYQKNKTHKNLIGIDKSTLSLNELASLLGKKPEELKDSYKTVNTVIGILLGTSIASIGLEHLIENVTGEAAAAAFQAVIDGIGKFFTDIVFQNLGASIGVVGIATALGIGAYTLIKKKIKESKEKQMLMEQEAEDKMDEGVQSRNVSNFKTSANLKTLAEEIANDPELQIFIENAIKSTSPAITPLMRLHMTKALNLAENMNKNAEKDAEKIDLERRLTKNAPEAAFDDYTLAVEKEKKMTELEAKKAIADRINAVDATSLASVPPLKAHLESTACNTTLTAALKAHLATPGKTVDTFIAECLADPATAKATIGYSATGLTLATLPAVKVVVRSYAVKQAESIQAEIEGKKLAGELGMDVTKWNDPTEISTKKGAIATDKQAAITTICHSVPVVHDPSLDSLTEPQVDTLLTAESITAPTGATKDKKLALYERALLDKKLVSDNILDNAIATRQAARTATKS